VGVPQVTLQIPRSGKYYEDIGNLLDLEPTIFGSIGNVVGWECSKDALAELLPNGLKQFLQLENELDYCSVGVVIDESGLGVFVGGCNLERVDRRITFKPSRRGGYQMTLHVKEGDVWVSGDKLKAPIEVLEKVIDLARNIGESVNRTSST